MTLCLLGKGLVWGEELKRGKVTESLVRAHGIVDAFPSPEIAIEGGELERVGDNRIELLGMGTLGAFDPAIELGRAGRQDEQAQAALLAGPFELGGELAAAVDLDGPQRERHSLFKRIEERARCEGGGPPMRFDDVPARDDIAAGKVFHYHAREGTHLKRVHLHQVSRPFDAVILGLPNRVRARSRTSADLHSIPKWLDQPASGFQVSQDATYLRGRNPAALPAEEHDQLVFAPARVRDPQPQDLLNLPCCPGRSSSPVRAVGTILQARQVLGIIATPPAVESLPADTEVAAGESGVPPVGAVVVHPSEPLPSGPAHWFRGPCQVPGTGYPSGSNLHGNTLPECHPSF